MPAYGVPQSGLYGMRGRYTDGNQIRNRAREQMFGGSGNPNMPIFNNAALSPQVAAQNEMQAQPGAGQWGQMSGMYGGGTPGYPGIALQRTRAALGAMGGYAPTKPAQYNPAPVGGYGGASGAMPNIGYNAPMPQFAQLQQQQQQLMGSPPVGFVSAAGPSQANPYAPRYGYQGPQQPPSWLTRPYSGGNIGGPYRPTS